MTNARICDILDDTGMDWLTITTTNSDHTYQLTQQAKILLDTEEALGGIVSKWGAMGYKGLKCNAVKTGMRGQDEAILIISGRDAQYYGQFVEVLAERITRLDIQVTVRTQVPAPSLAENVYQRLLSLKESGRYKPSIRLVKSETGNTVYSGKRGSAKMLRLYDRTRMYGEEALGTIWRYEVQYNKKASGKAWATLMRNDFDVTSVANLVYSEFTARQMEPMYDGTSDITAVEVGREVTDSERQVKWLTKCVRPVIIQLCNSGYEDAVLNALSLRATIKGVRPDDSRTSV